MWPSLAKLPAFGALKRHVPGLAATAGCRIQGTALLDRQLCYRASGGGIPAGLWVEPLGPSARAPVCWARDEVHATYLSPVAVGQHLASQVLRPGSPPAFAFFSGAAVTLEVPGNVLAGSGDGRVAVVVDRVARVLRAVDLTTLSVREVASIAGRFEPEWPPLVSLDEEGRRALFMDAEAERSQVSLVWVDLLTGERKVLKGPLLGPAWLAGVFVPGSDEVITVEMKLGQRPEHRWCRVRPGVRTEKPILNLEVAQPACLPVFVAKGALVALLTLAPYPFATYGPVELVLIPLAGGARIPLTAGQQPAGRLRVADGAVWVEGKEALLELPFTGVTD